MTQLFDVVEVTIETQIVRRVVARNKSPRSAEAVITMAVIRHSPGDQGMDDYPPSFWTKVPTGMYRDGDAYRGNAIAEDEPQ